MTETELLLFSGFMSAIKKRKTAKKIFRRFLFFCYVIFHRDVFHIKNNVAALSAFSVPDKNSEMVVIKPFKRKAFAIFCKNNKVASVLV